MKAPFLTLSWLLVSGLAFAHGMRSAYLEISLLSPNSALVFWKVTIADPRTLPVFPVDCRLTDKAERKPSLWTAKLLCGEALAGREIRVEGMGPLVSETVVHVSGAPGGELSQVLTASRSVWPIPDRHSTGRVLWSYVRMGLTHIYSGTDHLLFLLGLLLLVQSPRRVISTVTAFTVAHSLTLSLSVLGWLRVSSEAAEACIALSLIFAARELWHKKRAEPYPRGFRLAFVFGLAHGLGFANGLREIGIPENAVPVSLLGFNLGVELGQVALLSIALIVLSLVSRRRGATFGLQKLGAGLIGSLGSFWFLERSAAILSPFFQ